MVDKILQNLLKFIFESKSFICEPSKYFIQLLLEQFQCLNLDNKIGKD